MKSVRVVLSPKAEATLDELTAKATRSKKERTLVKGFHKKIEMIKYDFQYGEPIGKKLIPNEYKINYNATNLFRVELPGFWRMMYALKNGLTDDEVVVLILDIIDHETYNKKFGYKKH